MTNMDYIVRELDDYARTVAMSRYGSERYSTDDINKVESYRETKERETKSNYESWISDQYQQWRNKHHRKMDDKEYADWCEEMYWKWRREKRGY